MDLEGQEQAPKSLRQERTTDGRRCKRILRAGPASGRDIP